MRATWFNANGEEVVTLCNESKCRLPIVPNEHQLERMEAMPFSNVKEEAQFRIDMADM